VPLGDAVLMVGLGDKETKYKRKILTKIRIILN
jgi:hypothetical protein